MHGCWVAVHVRAGRERGVANQLSRHGYDVFLPMRMARRTMKSRTTRELPLFPGYLFCRYQTRPAFRIVEAPGVREIVNIRGVPQTLQEFEIEAIRQIVMSGAYVESCDMIQVGKRVRIQSGPLSGIEGVLLAHRTSSRIVVSIPILMRAVTVELSGAAVIAA